MEKNISTLRNYRKSYGKRSKGGCGSSDKYVSKCSYMGYILDFGRIKKTQKSAFAANLVANTRELERLQNLANKETFHYSFICLFYKLTFCVHQQRLIL